MMARAARAEGDIDSVPTPAERLSLLLPSSLPIDMREEHLIRNLAAKEVRLRVAQAEDSLAVMRRNLRILADVFVFREKQLTGQGNKAITRSRAIYGRFRKKVDLMAARYRAARSALEILQPDPKASWRTPLPILDKNDIRSMKESEPGKEGEGAFEMSWIWRRAPSGSDDIPHELVRVEWAKMRARVFHWREEKELLVEEMRRVVEYFKWKSAWWTDRAGCTPLMPIPRSKRAQCLRAQTGRTCSFSCCR